MAKPEVHPSFFAEEMYYHLRDEQYPQPDYNHNTLVSSSPEATLTSRPLLPTAAAPPTVSMPSFISTKAESESSLPRPRVLAGHVNVSQVLPITDELWNSVSVDYDADASTPGSDETANSTLTPRLDLPFPFTQPFFQQGFGGNTVTGGYAAKHAVFNPSALHTYAAATLSPASWVQLTQNSAAMQPSSTITPVSPKAVMPASVFAQDQHVAQGPSRLADIPRQENLVLDSGVSTKNDPVDTLLDAPAPEDGNVPNARYPRSNSSMDPHARRKWESKLLFREWKKGTPYRRIKAMGNFNVAESTLRGRIRTMIKGKSECVHHPEWTAKDEDLLRQAVAHYSHLRGQFIAKGRAAMHWQWVWLKHYAGSHIPDDGLSLGGSKHFKYCKTWEKDSVALCA